MNAKKAKKLRALVRHLQNTEVITTPKWVVYDNSKEVVKWESDFAGEPRRTVITGSIKLDPTCGRAIYKQMKKRTGLTGQA